MSLKGDPKYPSRLSYVVKFRGDATAYSLSGRIENLVTGRQQDFNSGSDLLECIAGDLLVHRDEPSNDTFGGET